jgi:hypothetical protein
MSCITRCNAFGQAPKQQCDSLKAEVANLERCACLVGRHCSIPATHLDGM